MLCVAAVRFCCREWKLKARAPGPGETQYPTQTRQPPLPSNEEGLPKSDHSVDEDLEEEEEEEMDEEGKANNGNASNGFAATERSAATRPTGRGRSRTRNAWIGWSAIRRG